MPVPTRQRPVPERDVGERAARAAEIRVLERVVSPETFEHLCDWDAALPARWYVRRGRRCVDLALLALVLPLALVPLALVALANLAAFRDPRKVLYVQPRVGWRGRIFRIYKFRTMRDVPVGAAESATASAMASWSSGADRARVTRLGRLLRNTHLDELPQLLNVVRGEMSFIGPRPEMVEVEAWASEHVPGFSRRLAIRPGVTGWAQITQGYTGMCVHAYREKLAANERYLREASPAKDLEIVVRTALWMLRGRGWGWRSQAAASADRSADG